MQVNRVFRLMLGVGLLTMSLVWISSCSDDNMMNNNSSSGTPLLSAVTPSTGAAGVALDAAIGIKFNTRMDTSSVGQNFHLTGGPFMQAWMDSMMSEHQMNGMNGMDMLDMMNMHEMMGMNHNMAMPDSMHVSGSIEWNSRLDSCRFTPNIPLRPDTEYIVCLHEGIRNVEGRMMEMMGMGTFSHGGYMHSFRTRR